ncbi:uncharacterized protein G2W53_027488 [Senna tora]|uniref:Uncharacterized protein n=1 Tax=Senna tora TaxID=362788 RepID=A0A834WIG7_9FABA|nr:uncharacterized protein G2W53_027488 [Senna tora]
MEREESNQSGKSKDVLPFCLVLIWPKDADDNSTIEEVVKVFEEKDQRLFQISQQTREKVISVIEWKHRYWYVCRDNLKISEKPFGEGKKIQVTREITQGLKQAIRNKVKVDFYAHSSN